jgi:ketosteroid isomerase-like protein
MPMRHRILLATCAAFAVAVAGCGQDPNARFNETTPPLHRGAAALRASPTPTPRKTQHRPTQREAEHLRPVIAGWANALRHGDAERAARYFALPAIVAQSDTLQLATREDARLFNAALPCGARLLEVQHNGRFIVGTFRLTARPGQTCLTEGARVRVAFVISDRHFTEWRQVPDTPGAKPGPSKPEDLQTLPRPGADGEETA